MKLNVHDQIRANKRNTVFLITVFLVLIYALSWFLGALWGNPWFGLILVIPTAIIYVMIAWYSGSNIILATMGARPVTKQEYPYLYHSIEGLSIAAGIPTPKAYVIDDSALNAFATGRDPEHGVLCFTTGILNRLNRQELEGVIAHEIAHIKNYDIRYMMLVTVLIGIVTLLSDFLLRSFLWGSMARDRENNQVTMIMIGLGLLFAILSPFIGYMVRMAMSRQREYLADATGAHLTRYPQGLADALRKISEDPDPLVDKANKASAHLFISTPFRKTKSFVSKLFATHPPIEDRIKKLESM